MSPSNNAILALVIAGSFIACQGDPKQSEAYKQLEQEHQRALTEHQQQLAQKDSAMDLVVGTFARVSENLRAIRTHEGQLVGPMPNAEAGEVEEAMMADIQSIDGLLAENRRLIARLRSDAKASAEKMAELERAIAAMEQQISEKDTEIDALKKKLSSTNQQLARMINMYKGQAKIAALQLAELNTAYYVVGGSKELRNNGVLTREGGLAGIGATDKLKTGEMNKKAFTKIDLSQTGEVNIGAKKARLATPHPDGSYTLVDGADRLVINDKEAFWSLSKYLVVVVVK